MKIARHWLTLTGWSLLGLIVLGAYLLDPRWHTSAEIHTMIEVWATLTALFAAAVALVRHYTRKSELLLYLGVGFLGTALLDGYHALVTSPMMAGSLPSGLKELIPWSWTASRLFLSVMLWLAATRRQIGGADDRSRPGTNDGTIYTTAASLTLATFIIFSMFPLPAAYYPSFLLHRPAEIIPAVFFGLALYGMIRSGEWLQDAFYNSLVVCLVANLASQILFMPFSVDLFDLAFDAAHILKVFSYIVVLAGLLCNTYSLFRQGERDAAAALAANRKLERQAVDRRLAEVALRRSEERFRQFAENIDAVFWMTSADKKEMHYISPAYEDIWGQTLAELYDRPISWVEAIHPDDRDRVLRAAQKGQATGDYLEEFRIVRTDGTVRWIRDRAFPITDSDGEVRRVCGIAEDVTDRREAVDAIQDREQQLNEAQRIARLGSWSWDVATNKVTWSDELYRIWDVSKETFEPSFEGVLSRMPQEDAERLQQVVTDAMETRQPYTISHRVICRDGSVRRTLGRGRVVTDADGQVTQLHGTSQDITEQWEADEAVRDSERKVRAILDNARYFVGLLDPDGRILELNRAAAELIVTTVGEDEDPARNLVGRRFWDIETWFPTERHRAWVRDGLARAAGGERVEGETRLHTSQGPIDIDFSFTPVLDENGDVVLIVPEGRDISTHKQAQVALEEARDTAEENSRTKSEFLANVSHELRTPMNGIIGMTDLALDTELSDEQEECLSAVKDSALTLLDLLNDILDFSKIEARKLTIENEPFDLHDTLAGTIKSFALRAREKGLELICDIAPDLPRSLSGDSIRLRQVLVNLIGNAIKFTEQGEVLVTAGLAGPVNGRAQVEIAVRDTGVGIPEAQHEAIFGAFKQADGSSTRRFGGTGLGLTISAQLVKLMGGTIDVESTPGDGSTFRFVVPLTTCTEPPAAECPSTLEELKGKTALIVDDNRTNRSILTKQLSRWGLASEEMPSGTEALSRLATQADAGEAFDIVLLDAHMPGVDGFDVARAVRDEESLGHPRVLMLTSLDRSREHFSALGIHGYLVKPVFGDDLKRRMLEVFGQPLPEAGADEAEAEAEELDGSRILLAEDNAINARLAIRLLEKWGHDVTHVEDGAQAVSAVESHEFDLVLMDVQMPIMDGIDATKAIREAETNGRRLPIIALTAHALSRDRARCVEAGMDDYLTKPIDRRALRDAVRNAAENGGHHADTQADTAEPEATDNPAVEEEAPIFDREQALERVDGDTAFLNELIGEFNGHVERLWPDLAKALGNDDHEAVKRLAHSIKGAAMNLGADGIATSARALEHGAEAGANVERLFERLEQQVERFGKYTEALA